MYNAPQNPIIVDSSGRVSSTYDDARRTSLINDRVRVYKGGSWRDRLYWLSPSSRRFLQEDFATDFIGFRCAMDYVGDSYPQHSRQKSKMAFHDISFLFILFPVVLLAHKVMPQQGKNLVLLLFSLLFYAWGEPRYVVLMVLSIAFNYFTGLAIGAYQAAEQPAKAKFALTSAVVTNLLLLGFFKYAGFLVDNLAVLGLKISVPAMTMPIGISFFTFSILSYLFDVYRGKAPVAENVLEFSLFVTFFPKLVSGPIVQYAKMQEQIRERVMKPAHFGQGCRLFLIGLAKKMLLSNTIGTAFYALNAMDQVSVVSAWLGALCYTLMLYYDFGGYSDMAIGIAKMFGFDFDKNFDYPYTSASVTEFWRRWHMSLGSWFRDYIYIPLGGNRVPQWRWVLNILAVWMLTGLWHGAAWNFVIWGLLFAALLLLEKWVPAIKKLPGVLRHATSR